VIINLIAMGRGEGQTPEEVERAQKFVELKKQKEARQEEIDKLRQQIEDLIQKNRETLAARDKLAMLKEMLNNQEEIDADRNELIAHFNLLQTTNEQLVANQKSLQEEIKKKEDEIARRKLPPKPAALRVRPSGSSTNTRPFFVEISDTSIYIHRSLSKEPVAIPIASLNQSKEFIDLLKKVASQPYNRLIFLVRGNKSAAKAFHTVNGLVSAFNSANKTRIIPGRLPLPGKGLVDLQVFAQFLEP